MKSDSPVEQPQLRERRQFLKIVGGSVVMLGCGLSGCGGSSTNAGAEDSGSPDTDAGSQDAGPMCATLTESTSGSNSDFCQSTAGKFNLGPASQYTLGGLELSSNMASGVLVGLDSKGYYALSSLCTHECCDMNSGSGLVTSQGITCVCHGSVFGVDGHVIRGPARRALDAYALEVDCDGNLFVDTTQVVPSSQRLAV